MFCLPTLHHGIIDSSFFLMFIYLLLSLFGKIEGKHITDFIQHRFTFQIRHQIEYETTCFNNGAKESSSG